MNLKKVLSVVAVFAIIGTLTFTNFGASVFDGTAFDPITHVSAGGGGGGGGDDGGHDGEDGKDGHDGKDGKDGHDGAPGPKGDKGDTGPAGPAGPQGPAGPVGPQGPAGQNGTNGEDGTDGTNGEDGATGPAGPAGPAGETGPQGPAGEDGLQGPAGPAGPQGPAGPAGEDGKDGKTIYLFGGPSTPACIQPNVGLDTQDISGFTLGTVYKVTLNGVTSKFVVLNGTAASNSVTVTDPYCGLTLDVHPDVGQTLTVVVTDSAGTHVSEISLALGQ